MSFELPLPTLYNLLVEKSLHSQTFPSLGTPQAQKEEGTSSAAPPHHSNPGSPRISAYLCTLIFWTLGGSTSIPEPPTRSTSFQASHPSSPRQLYQNQLRVCADLFLIAGAWFTLAPPPNIDSIIWRVIDVRDLDECQNRLLSGPGPGPNPPILRFHRGAQKGQLTSQGHTASALRGWDLLTFFGTTVQHPSSGKRRYTEASGSDVRSGGR